MDVTQQHELEGHSQLLSEAGSILGLSRAPMAPSIRQALLPFHPPQHDLKASSCTSLSICAQSALILKQS